MRYAYDAKGIQKAVREALLASILFLATAAMIYAPVSLARDDDNSMSGQSGQRGSAAEQSSSGQGGAPGGHKGHHKGHQKKQENSTSSQSGASGSALPNAERTGVTGDAPSGGRSETSGQERGPSGY